VLLGQRQHGRRRGNTDVLTQLLLTHCT
jgi:hypothetical protein